MARGSIQESQRSHQAEAAGRRGWHGVCSEGRASETAGGERAAPEASIPHVRNETEMQTEPEISFLHVEPTEAIRKKLVDEIDRLDRLDDRLIACRVKIDLPERRHKKGNLYHVRIDLTTPGEEIVVDRHPPGHQTLEDPLVAIGEAFDAARKRLIQAKDRRRREMKHHEEPARGRISRLVPEEDHGFIDAADGHEVYFHRNAVAAGAFDRLEIGTGVRFLEEEGDKGAQATIVEP